MLWIDDGTDLAKTICGVDAVIEVHKLCIQVTDSGHPAVTS